MRKGQAVVFMFCLACTVILGAQEKKIRVITETANIHIEPHRTSTVIEAVKRGAVLTLFESGHQQKAWYYVSFYPEEKWATITGFIEAVKVELVGGTPPPEEDKTEVAAVETKEEKTDVAFEKKEQKAELKTEAETEPAQAKAVAEEEETEVAPADKGIPLVRVLGEVQVVGDNALLCATASEESRMLAMISVGTLLELTGKKGDWYRVKYFRNDGIVMVGFIHGANVSMFTGATTEKNVVPEEKAVEKKQTAVPADPKPEQVDTRTKEELQKSPERPSYESMPAENPDFSVGLMGGYALPSEEGYGGAFAFGFSLAYRMTSNLSVELSGLRFQSQLEGSPEGLSRGKLTMFPLSLNLKGSYPASDRFSPYAIVGIGYFFNSFALCDCIQAEWNPLGFDVREDVENSWGFLVGAGLDYFLAPNLSVNLDIRYGMSKTKGSWSFTDQVTGAAVSGNLEKLSLNTLVLGLGVKFYFSLF